MGLQTHLLTGDEGNLVHVDDIYARQKQNVLSSDDGSGKPTTVNYSDPKIPTGNPVTLTLDQEYVYGLDYIDELVAFYSHSISLPNWRYVLQDASYNVVGYVNHTGVPLRQFAYHPYGRLQAVETGAGVPSASSELAMLYKGLWLDREAAGGNRRSTAMHLLGKAYRAAEPRTRVNVSGCLAAPSSAGRASCVMGYPRSPALARS